MKRKTKNKTVPLGEHVQAQHDVQGNLREGYLLGLLECPLHKGFIEFEYQPGDLVSELTDRIEAVWGPMAPSRQQHWWWDWDPSGWAILCQDEDGAFLALGNDARIPTKPPTGNRDTENFEMRRFIPGEKGSEEAIHYMDIVRSLRVKAHLSLKLHREYEIPEKGFTVRLVALVQLTGG